MPEAVDLIKKLCHKDPGQRLGCRFVWEAFVPNSSHVLCPDTYFAGPAELTTFARILSSTASTGPSYTAGGSSFYRMTLLFHECADRTEYLARRMRSPFQGSDPRETANQLSAKAQLKDTVVRIFCFFLFL